MKTLLSTTALAVLLATGVHAGGHMASYVEQAEPTDVRGSEFIGSFVYTAEFEPGDLETMTVRDERLMVGDAERDWNNIGEVSDVLLSRDGELRAVLLDIGGFLGLGEKTVAVSMDSLRFVRDGNNADDYFLVVNASKDALMEAPEFEIQTMEQRAEATADEIVADVNAAADEIVAETNEAIEAGERAADTVVSQTVSGMEADRAPIADLQLDGYERVALEDVTTEDLTGTEVYGIGDENLGEISELVVGSDGTIEQAVIDVGGFLGLGEKPVAVSFDQLSIQRNATDGFLRVYIDATEESLEQLPEYGE